MLTIDEAQSWLEECMDKLPPGIVDELNGGVNLLPDRREDADGLLTMGMYIVDACGRRVELYYGSFQESLADAPEEELRQELDKTLRHELTHHVESLAGDRSLEKWDERQREELLSDFAPLDARSVLFVDWDDASLAPLCSALFQKKCREGDRPFRCASAGLREASRVEKHCAAAAEELGLSLADHRPRLADADLLRDFDAVLCLSLEAARELAERFPDFEEKIMCLGYTDYAPPRLGLKSLWRTLARGLSAEVDNLMEDMTEGCDDSDQKR